MYILMSYVIYGETWFHDLGGLAVEYIPDTTFEYLDDGYRTECILKMRFFTWCIVKLYCHVTLFSAFHVLIVANHIIHMRIKIISWH